MDSNLKSIKSSVKIPTYEDLVYCLKYSIDKSITNEEKEIIKAIIQRTKVITG